MKLLAAAVMSCALASASPSHAQGSPPRPEAGALQTVSPALERYEQETVFGNLWRRPDLSTRDRSIVTLAALITRNQAAELPRYLGLALHSGVTPGEVSELITHLAFYAGWGNAMGAIPSLIPSFCDVDFRHEYAGFYGAGLGHL
jgi:4-carboxymuconolactone decarboxylase